MIVLEIVIAGLDVTAELEWVITGFEAKQIITALRREGAHEISNILLLELEKDIEEREETLFFPLYFLLEIRVKANSLASNTLIAILILKEDIRKRSEP